MKGGGRQVWIRYKAKNMMRCANVLSLRRAIRRSSGIVSELVVVSPEDNRE